MKAGAARREGGPAFSCAVLTTLKAHCMQKKGNLMASLQSTDRRPSPRDVRLVRIFAVSYARFLMEGESF